MSCPIRWRALALLLLTAVCTCALPVLARADRAPTPAELHSIKAQVGAASFFRISTVDPTYVSLHYGTKNGAQAIDIVQRLGKRVRVVLTSGPGEPRDGACAFAPAAVVTDLLGVHCPIWTALHARHANPIEKALLIAAYRKNTLTHVWARVSSLFGVCISRLDPHWASAVMAFGSTSGIVWFQRHTTRWEPVYETVASKGIRPTHAIVLSLAACVGYNAGQYGG